LIICADHVDRDTTAMYLPSNQSNDDSPRRRLFGGALVVVWIAALAFGWWKMVSYEFGTTPWNEIQYADVWPPDSLLELAKDRPTLLVFIHPKCPCTRATLNELDRLMASLGDRLSTRPAIRLVATVPAAADESWWDTSLVDQGQRISDREVNVDRAGQEAARFGAATSGTLMLFDKTGERRYAGGITVSRGHEGLSAGADSLRKLLVNPAGDATVMPAFGCRLCLPNDVAPDPAQPQTQPIEIQATRN
jgi:hypothetical protein